MHLREQRYVLAIGRHGSIKEAARELCVSPPTLSIFLKNLEKDLGLPLFDRLGKKFVPTFGGRAYMEYARKMVHLDREFSTTLGDIKKNSAGELRLGLHRRRTTYLLPRVLGAFMRSHPEVEVQLCESDSERLFEGVLSGELDMIVDNRVSSNPLLEYIPFYADRLLLVVPAEHPKVSRGAVCEGKPYPWIDLKLFDGETFILQKPLQSSRKYAENVMALTGVLPGSIFTISNMEAASQLAAEALGVAFTMLAYTRSYVYDKPVRYFLVGDPDETIPYFMIRRKDRYMPLYIKDFMDIMKNLWGCGQGGW